MAERLIDCPNCGEPLGGERANCPHCGNSLPEGTEDSLFVNADKQEGRAKRNMGLAAGGCLLLLALIVVIAPLAA